MSHGESDSLDAGKKRAKSTVRLCHDSIGCKDRFGSDTNEIGFECHLSPYFNPNMNADAHLIGYEYKIDSSNPDSDPDTFSI